MRFQTHCTGAGLAGIFALLGLAGPVRADEGPAASPYRNAQGSIALGGGLEASFSSDVTIFAVGLGLGYAVLTGVLPGIRGTLLSISVKDEPGGQALSGMGGELAGTLTLTPPLPGPFVPFAFSEAGRRWDPGGHGWIYGVGGGAYLGEMHGRVGLQLGYVFRRFARSDGSDFDLSGPLVALSISF